MHKKGHIKLLFSVLLLVVMLYTLDAFYTWSLKNNYNLKASQITGGNINADVLFTGSSNVLYMVDPEVFEKESGLKMYNLASNHAAFTENLAYLELYLQNNKKPGYLCIGISMADLTISGSAFHSYLFAPFLNNIIIQNILKFEDPYYYWVSKLPFGKYAYYNTDLNYPALQGLTNHRLAYYAKGTGRVPQGPKGFQHYAEIVKKHNGTIAYKWTEKQDKDLTSLISYATNKGIKVYLYEPPFWAESKKDYVGREDAVNHLDRLAKANKTTFWTFDTLRLCINKENFETVFHTKDAAGKEFTKVLAEKIKKI